MAALDFSNVSTNFDSETSHYTCCDIQITFFWASLRLLLFDLATNPGAFFSVLDWEKSIWIDLSTIQVNLESFLYLEVLCFLPEYTLLSWIPFKSHNYPFQPDHLLIMLSFMAQPWSESSSLFSSLNAIQGQASRGNPADSHTLCSHTMSSTERPLC